MLSDNVACRKALRARRRYSQKAIRSKRVTIPLFKEGRLCSAYTNIMHNISTGQVTLSHGMSFYRAQIHPTTNGGKIKCTTPQGAVFIRGIRESRQKCEKSEMGRKRRYLYNRSEKAKILRKSENARRARQQYNKNHVRYLNFSSTIAPGVELIETVWYNKKTGTCGASGCFHAVSGYRLLYIAGDK